MSMSLVDQQKDTANAASYVFSFTPTANRLLVVYVFTRYNSAGDDATPTLSDDGPGLTWNQRGSVATTGSTLGRLTVFTADSGSSPGTFNLTADFASHTQLGCIVNMQEDDGSLDRSAAPVQVVSDDSGSTQVNTEGVTLAAFADATNNYCVLGVGMFQRDTSLSGDGTLTTLGNLNSSGEAYTLGSAYQVGENTSPSMTRTGGGASTAVAIGLELAIATGGSPPSTPTASISAVDDHAVTVALGYGGTRSTEITGWNVYLSETDGFTPGAGNQVISGASNTDLTELLDQLADTTALAGGKTYYCVIEAENSYGSTQSAQLTIVMAPERPVSPTASAGSATQITAGATAADGTGGANAAASYQCFWCPHGTNAWEPAPTNVLAGGSITDTLNVPEGNVDIAWTAMDDAGRESGLSAIATVDTTRIATSLHFATQPSDVNVGVAIDPSPAVEVLDQYGNRLVSAANDVTIAIGSDPPGGTTLGGTTTVAAASGLATFSDLTLDQAGASFTLTASATGLTGETSTAFDVVDVSPVATALEFLQQPSNALVSAVLDPPVSVRCVDQFGELYAGFTGDITVAIGLNPGGATLGGTLVVAAVGGIASFADLTLDAAAAGYTLTASATGLGGATSTSFDVAAVIALTRSSVFFYSDFATGPEPEVGGQFRFTRDTAKWIRGRDGLWHLARAGQWGYGWDDLAAAIYAPPYRRPGFDLAVALTGLVTNSVIEAGSSWTTSAFTLAGAKSIFEGGGFTPIAFTHDGVTTGSAGSVYQGSGAGTFDGSRECPWAIFENVDAAHSKMALRDNTSNQEVRAVVDWSDLSASADGALSPDDYGVIDLGYGPNGGRLAAVWFSYTGTAGNYRQVKCYPDGDQNGKSCIVHYIQDELGRGYPSSPLPYSGSPESRDGDVAYYAPAPVVADLLLSAAFVAGDFSEQYKQIVAIGSSAGARVLLQTGGSSGQLRAFSDDGSHYTGNTDISLGIRPGNYVEAAVLWTRATGEVYCIGRVWDGAAVSANDTPSSWSPPTAWGTEKLGIGIGTDSLSPKWTGRLHRVMVVKPADMASDPVADPDAALDELRGFRLDAGGYA